MNFTKTVSFSMDTDLAKRIEDKAYELKTNRSKLVSSVMKKYLDSCEVSDNGKESPTE